MKYREVSKYCATEGCGKPRDGRHRFCRGCLNKRKSERLKQSKTPNMLLERVIREVKKRPEAMTDEFKRKLDELAAKVADQLDAFNAGAARAR